MFTGTAWANFVVNTFNTQRCAMAHDQASVNVSHLLLRMRFIAKAALTQTVLHATFAALVIFGSVACYAQTLQPSLHPLNEPCISCHLAGTNTTASNAERLVASQEQLCGRCHTDTLQLSHPSGFVPPGKAIPAGYPLDWKGELTCSTCHKVHSNSPDKLRNAARGRNMCLDCHKKSFFNNMRDGGVSVVQSIHKIAPDTIKWQGVDFYSIQCMECHNNESSTNSASQLSTQQDLHTHSIGHDYANAERYGGYRPVAWLPKKILLPSGMVGCVSCHEGYTKNHGQIVNINNGVSLCYQCHTD